MPSIDGAVRETAPCKGCKTRQPGCHGTCEGYKSWRRTVDQANEARRKYRDRPLSQDSRRKTK